MPMQQTGTPSRAGRDERDAGMTEQDARHDAGQDESQTRQSYDVHATEAKWLPVWEKLDPFRADDDSPREKRYALTMFPYPSGDLHMGHAEVTALHDVIARYWWQRGYEVLNPIGWDSFGLPAENAAIQRNEHPATYTYANIETQAASFKQVRRVLRLVPPAAHLRPGVLPLDAVAVPEAARAGAGLPQVQPGELVPQRPDRAGQRAGRRRVLRALRRRGDQARADPVVLQGHRLRPAAAGRHGRACDWPERVLDPAAQLDRPLRGRARRLRGEHRGRRRAARCRSTRPVRTPCSARPSWWSPPTRSWPRRSSATSSARRTRST